jgi:hypothetical protein
VLIELLTDADSVMTDIGGATVGRLTRDARTGDGDEIGALRIRGAHLALADPVIRTIEVELLDGRGVAHVDVRVANLLAFIVLKSFAVKGRTKDKDTFDLIWVLTYWPAGPAAAAAHARQCPRAEHPVVDEAMQLLEQEFATPAHNGCVRYADFSMGPGAARSSELHTLRCRDAHGTIREFLAAWRASDPQLPLIP